MRISFRRLVCHTKRLIKYLSSDGPSSGVIPSNGLLVGNLNVNGVAIFGYSVNTVLAFNFEAACCSVSQSTDSKIPVVLLDVS